MAPVVLALRAAPWAETRLVTTGQHRDLVAPMLDLFGLKADLDLALMRPDQTPADLTARLLTALTATLGAEAPAMVLAQGDTTTVLATALACFYARAPFGHVEAGLRTGNLAAPFPEEGNRVVASRLAALHFAPTPLARDNLLREGLSPGTIFVTGNTVIDALFHIARRPETRPSGAEEPAADDCKLVLVTAHRRDSFGAPIRRVCEAVAILHDRHPELSFLWPVHPNPAVKGEVEARLGRLARVRLCEPLPYDAFVSALGRAYLVVTDSGGAQEEAPALGKPVLVIRDETERPEAIAEGVARLIGTRTEVIVAEVERLLDDAEVYRSMARGASPYGDGHAAGRIVAELARALSVSG